MQSADTQEFSVGKELQDEISPGHGEFEVQDDEMLDNEYDLKLKTTGRQLSTEVMAALAERELAVTYLGEYSESFAYSYVWLVKGIDP